MIKSQFVPYFGETTTIDILQKTVARYVGAQKAQDAFETFARQKGIVLEASADAEPSLMYHAEQVLAAHTGDSSAHIILALALHQHNTLSENTLSLFDKTLEAVEQRGVLQNALDHAVQGITVIDKDMNLIAMNNAFIRIADLPPHLAKIGVSFEKIVRFNAERKYYGEGDVEELVAKRLNHMKKNSEPRRLDIYPNGKDQPAVVLEMMSNQLPDGGVITTYTDITERVRTDEELAEIRRTLEARVEERTQELVKAKAAAEEANASKTRFLAAASHDLQQPLHAARLFAESLVSREGEAGATKNAERVCEALDSVEEIINALLEISKLDTGAVQTHVTNFRLDEIWGALEREFRPMAEAKNLELHFVKTTMAVRSDRRLLRRALQNLISNAIKYTLKGKVLVGVRLRGDKINIQVCDTGLGIPENKHKSIFVEFERLDEGRRTAKGLGLGLSIVERIASVLHHPLRFESIVKRGTVFSIELPLSPVLPEKMASAPSSSGLPFPVPVSGTNLMEGMIVLTIDDEKPIRDGMDTLLSKWGCKVITAENLRSARIKLKEYPSPPDVIIADYDLGEDEGNGIEAITALRWALDTSKPAILLTADHSQDVIDETRNKNIFLHNKPVKPAVLRALLTQWKTRSIT
jgi:signal transduction histidine kinase/CheY-like chemotaxis protein